ncbi:MAG: hypothetical protein JO223_15670 [Hyphomicrobiales bacterium]|nr:hypothetical protein [Hyphomicrobiales bacterium]
MLDVNGSGALTCGRFLRFFGRSGLTVKVGSGSNPAKLVPAFDEGIEATRRAFAFRPSHLPHARSHPSLLNSPRRDGREQVGRAVDIIEKVDVSIALTVVSRQGGFCATPVNIPHEDVLAALQTVFGLPAGKGSIDTAPIRLG